MGREERTAFIKTNFPTFVSHWPPQYAVFAFILLTTSVQREGGLGPKVKGRPRYLIFSHLSYPGNPNTGNSKDNWVFYILAINHTFSFVDQGSRD